MRWRETLTGKSVLRHTGVWPHMRNDFESTSSQTNVQTTHNIPTEKMETKILLCGDSRMRTIEPKIVEELRLKSHQDFRVSTETYPGAGTSRIVDRILQKYNTEKFDQIYVMTGICDLTIKTGRRELTPQFRDKDSLLLFMTEEFRHAQETMLQITEMPVICELVGMDIEKYTGKNNHTCYQGLMDACIPEINGFVHRLNEGLPKVNLRTPRYATYVHKLRKGKRTTRYAYGLYDGVHYTQTFACKVAAKVSDCIIANRK